ncbi:MAG: cysteine--tRNA ligase [Phycisphaerales bacterium]|nr:cysteine--tRNA ligase [Phycisphaerales bacterium]
MLTVHNSLTNQKEPFISLVDGLVGMYVCGPTVSGESHLGHARPFIVFDVINRYLQSLGYKVRYVRNITDAGHFEEAGITDTNKIGNKALLEKLEPMELVQKYTRLFHDAMAQFNNLHPNIEPTATGHIIEQIDMIQAMIKNKMAYVVNGSVYFDIQTYHEYFSKQGIPYGILSNRKIEDLLETTRELDSQDEKKNKADFALWKKAPDKHLMRWTSPWGDGFPAWHIECSAMSKKYLGNQFDIHGGGLDLLFPHHECEIAQSVCVNNQIPAKYWLHNNVITIEGRKMGKSYNNVIKLSELFTGSHPLLTQAYHPMAIRFLILQSHYRSTLDFSNTALQSAEKAVKRLWDTYQQFLTFPVDCTDNRPADNIELEKKCVELVASFDSYMDDDFNTAQVIGSLFELLPTLNGLLNQQLPARALSAKTVLLIQQQLKKYIETILGIQFQVSGIYEDKMNRVMDLLIKLRKTAKDKKDFATSDQIRQELVTLGIQLKDEKDGRVVWRFI